MSAVIVLLLRLQRSVDDGCEDEPIAIVMQVTRINVECEEKQ